MYRSITNNKLIPSAFTQSKLFIQSKISKGKVEFPFSIDCINAQQLEIFLNKTLLSSTNQTDISPENIFVNKNNDKNNDQNIKIDKINIPLKMFYVDDTAYSFNDLKYLDKTTEEKKCKDRIRSLNKNSKDEAILSAKKRYQDTTHKKLTPLYEKYEAERLAREEAEKEKEKK